MPKRCPNRPINWSKTLPFSDLYRDLFNPLNENKNQPARKANRKAGPQHGVSPHEQRRHIIERFIARWRKEVGNDFYPAMRLILPDRDRDRGVYGLKENAIGKLLVKLMKIDKNSEDGYNLLHWKLPGHTTASRMAGDFAGRCYEVLSKRPIRTELGDMTIAEVNYQLDLLAGSASEAENLEIFNVFYHRMSAEELMWLIRIILKQMKIGASERSFFYIWHPDAESKWSTSSSLRQVCWLLWDPEVRLEPEQNGISVMSCFQPQLAQFQKNGSFQKMIEMLRTTPEDPEFWIEEKLDGERMQMHMISDPSHPGGKRFGFWSRKAKDYTYLYGNGYLDGKSSLTRHLKNAFAPGVRNIILDGEMITWDMTLDKMVPFGTLKTAALLEQQNKSNSDAAGGHRPLFRVFDILFLNDKQLTQYTLRDRHAALEKAVNTVPRRLEVHEYTKATGPEAIEPLLRDVVANSSEGLVLKNPRSMYRLNSRNDDWIKVKPEYMTEFGESLDCLVIGGYYGSGHRGGTLSSFLCGLRASKNHLQAGANEEKCLSFFKVGGGFTGEDYAEIKHRTEGKWIDWDAKNPPSEYIELGGGEARQFERPDVWIRPKDSVVLSAKAASVAPSESFAFGYTLRFPRFRRLRLDRTWDSALSIDEFQELREKVEEESQEKAMTFEDTRRRATKRRRVDLVIAGDSKDTAEFHGERTKLFAGLQFCILSESLKPFKKTKVELETLIKENGGTISQRPDATSSMIIIADKNVVKVASLIKGGDANIIRPRWLKDCLGQDEDGFLLPYEERHLFHGTDLVKRYVLQQSDHYGDSYARDVEVEELRDLLRDMPKIEQGEKFDTMAFLEQLESEGTDLTELRNYMFARAVVHFVPVGAAGAAAVDELKLKVEYCKGKCASELEDEQITHIVVVGDDDMEIGEAASAVRQQISTRSRVPRLVNSQWVRNCWEEKTVVDEETFAV